MTNVQRLTTLEVDQAMHIESISIRIGTKQSLNGRLEA
ncbi:hypothetical protein LINPERHAP1_LOCUS31109, partial [Linum perenne]